MGVFHGHFWLQNWGFFEIFDWKRPTQWGYSYIYTYIYMLCLSNRQRARPLRTRPHKRVTLIMLRVSQLKQASRSSTLEERNSSIRKHMFLATVTVADGQTAASWGEGNRNCLKYVRSNSMPSRLLPNSRTELWGSFVVLSMGKATKFVRTWGFSKVTRFRNTENLVNPLFWTWTWFKHGVKGRETANTHPESALDAAFLLTVGSFLLTVELF